MGDYAAVQNLIVKLWAFYVEQIPLQEDVTYSLSTEFLENLQRVMVTKMMVAHFKWEQFFSMSRHNMSTPELYLRYVIYACRQYSHVHLNIFERFLSVLALLMHLRVVTFDETNLSQFIPDIFMGLYESELKKSFGRCGGLSRFALYINNPKYLASNSVVKEGSANETLDDLFKLVNRLISEEKELPEDFRLEAADIDGTSITLAQKVLRNPRTELPSVPSCADMKAKLRDFPQQMVEQLAEKKRVLEAKAGALEEVLECCSNSDPKTNDVAGQMAHNAQFQDIIQAIIRYNNRSNSSNHANKNNRIQEEAWEILEHLKDTIKSFIKFLDEYDKE